MPAPVLVQCAWVRSGDQQRLLDSVRVLVAEHSEDFAVANSFVLVTNLGVSATFARQLGEVLGRSRVRVVLLGPAEVGARVDARAELRRGMPSVLGLRDLDALIESGVSDRSSLDRGAAQELATVFVPTGAYRRALAVLATHRFAVLTGPPEMGKTAIARMVGLAQMTAGWEAHECVRPEDLWRVLDRDRAQVFVADDAFGSTEYRPDAAERWAREMERILRGLDDRHWLIWTSRPAPLRAGLGRLHRERGAERFPAPGEVLVDASQLEPAEKTLILFRHAKAADLPQETRDEIRRHGAQIVAHPHFTPERIRRLVATLKILPPGSSHGLARVVGAELTNATEAMSTSFAALGPEHRDVLIAMLDTAPGPVTDHDLAAALRRHHPGALSHPPAELVDRMTDHFLRVRMRVAWVHPSWRDLVIEHLSEDEAARQRFLHSCAIHGTLLALSSAGGEAGARQLPLLKNDRDWDAMTDRVHELAPGLRQAELIGLLDAAADTLQELKSTAAEPEAEALARALLARVNSLWKTAHTPIALPELEAWLGLASLLSPRPSPPSIAVTWAELLPVTAPDISDYRSLERFADWLTLAELLHDYDPKLLHRLGFPGHSQSLIITFCDELVRDDDAQRIDSTDHAKRALERIPRLFPPLAGRADYTLYWLDGQPRERPTDHFPPWTSTPSRSHDQRSGQLDIQRVLTDL